MTGNELITLFKQGTKRYHLVGSLTNGIIVGLDLEGRLYTIFNGEVVSKVNPDAINNITTRDAYLNPGGDGLWPAPEGTSLGYEYSTGKWRVPPGLTGAKYKVTDERKNHVIIAAEVDLINASGLGISTIFRRDISIETDNGVLTVKTIESIEYINSKPLSRKECLLAPWSLCQFDCDDGCEVTFPAIDSSEIWDMYDSSKSHRYLKDGAWHINTDGTLRFQIGISKKTPWIQLHIPQKKLQIHRTSLPLSNDQNYIDITDADPSEQPSAKGVRYSVYCDTDKFMEIEAAGGCPETLTQGTKLNLEVITEYKALE
jgi:hypothetical protein